ncbi:unnamed protein product [Closterium sp. NIES-54]
MAAAKRVLRYLCSTSGMGLVLGGRRPVVLTGHADASWADDQATQRSSQGYTFSLGSGSVSWRSTRSSSVLSSSCEAEIYAGAMAAQELRWLTYLLIDLGEQPRSPPVLYVDNKAMLALCREHRLEHRTKHIALRYFLARELQQRGQLRLAYVASEANTADIFTKALAPGDHQRFCTLLDCVVFLLCAAPHSSEFPPTEAPLQTLHMDVWGPARIRGQVHERYFLLVVDDYSRYTIVFPLRRKGEVTEVLIDWIRGARRQLSESFGSDLPVLRLHSHRGGEFSSDLLRAFCRAEGICQSFTLPASPRSYVHDPCGCSPRSVRCASDQPSASCLLARDHTYSAVDVEGWRCLCVPCPTSADKLSSRAGPAHSGVSQVDPVEPVKVAVDSSAARGAEPGGAGPGGAEPGGAELERDESGGPPGVPSRQEPLSPLRLCEWYARHCSRAAGGASGAGAAGGAAGAGAAGAAGPGGAGAGGTGAVGGPTGVGAAGGVGGSGAAGPGGARTGGPGVAGAGGAAGVGAIGAGAVATGGATGARAAGGTGAGGAAGVVAGDLGAEGTGAVSAVSGGAARPRPYYVPLLQQVLGLPPSTGPTSTFLIPPPVQTQSQLQPASGPSPYSGPTRGLTERREPESRPASPESHPASPESHPESPVRAVRTGRPPPATADISTRSQWLSRDATARLAIRNVLTKCAHFGEHRTAQALYDAVVARYSSRATAAIGRLLLPYLFPEISAFATVADLVTHLRTIDARYRATVPAEDHFLTLDPTSLTIDLLEQHLLAAETSAVAVGASRGTPRSPFFEGCSPSPLSSSFASAAAADVSVPEDVGAASTSAKRRNSKGKGGRGSGGGSGGGGGGSGSGSGGSGRGGGGSGGDGGTGGRGGGSGGGGGGRRGSGGSRGSGTSGGRSGPQRGGPDGGRGQQQQRRSETQTPQQLREWLVQRGAGEGSETCPYRPRWAELLRSGVAIFDLDFDVLISSMHALSFSAEGDFYWCVPPDPGIAAAALGASASGTPPGTAPGEALQTFTLDSSASRCFFRDTTTLTPLPAPVPIRLADPSGGLVIASSSTVLPCPVVLSGSLSSLHLPSFSTNLVSTAALQDAMVTTTTPGGQCVSICTCTRTGRHLATFTRRPGSSLYTLATEPPQVAASAQVSALGQVAASCSCRLLSHQTLLWHHRLGHPSLPRLRGMHSRLLVSSLPRSLPPLPPLPAPPSLPCVEGRQRAAPHSSSFPPTTAPLQNLHMDVWGPARISGQGRECYFLLVVDNYSRYTTIFPLRSKGEVSAVLIPWIRTVRLQLREQFGQDLPVLRLHSNRSGEFSSDLLQDFCRGEGILPSFTFPDSPQQNGIA